MLIDVGKVGKWITQNQVEKEHQVYITKSPILSSLLQQHSTQNKTLQQTTMKFEVMM